ncbi:hypothetical protein CG436_16480 [Pantoea ananatis]|nr:hypothetical protein CG436_16480 [Pantoea ananatis]
MMIDVSAKKVNSPLFKIIMYLNKYDESVLYDENLQHLFKNLSTHFKKLFYMTTYIHKIQKDEEALKKYNGTAVVSISSIEYCYYKISTIWDIAYQIAEYLIFPGKLKMKKYDYLNARFKEYITSRPGLDFKWYIKLNKIRNRIVHGGITVNPFYIDDNNVKQKICFQAYDFQLNDLIVKNSMYSNVYNNFINFADYFFTFHTHLLYTFLIDFFEFILIEFNKGKEYNLEDLSLSNGINEVFESMHKTWLLSDVDVFCKVTQEMISLSLNDGRIMDIDNISLNKVKTVFNSFPFSLMRNIIDGDWVLAKE